MKSLYRALTLPLLALVLAGCVPHPTGETEVGVRTIKLGLFARKGVEDKAYAPGSTYFFSPFINDWHTFDTKLQNLEMTFETSRGDRKGRDDLLFKTIDGNDIGMDVIIAYRIDPNMSPYILQNVAKNNRVLAEKIVRTVARSKPRDIFGELKTEEFYVAEKREAQAQHAHVPDVGPVQCLERRFEGPGTTPDDPLRRAGDTWLDIFETGFPVDGTAAPLPAVESR